MARFYSRALCLKKRRAHVRLTELGQPGLHAVHTAQDTTRAASPGPIPFLFLCSERRKGRARRHRGDALVVLLPCALVTVPRLAQQHARGGGRWRDPFLLLRPAVRAHKRANRAATHPPWPANDLTNDVASPGARTLPGASPRVGRARRARDAVAVGSARSCTSRPFTAAARGPA